ncbi:hypothetical protein [Aureimonas sp. AU4]|uniref:hypothetical protein n=1 Tax=Aureimonas sp. AU4 TaxID=1638163 RepID=UPI0007861233|nr:hypothetical protein [Aureimonas sp. AU4]
MRHLRNSGWNGLAALRRERSAFAALGLLLLTVQLLLSGFGQGAVAAERLAAPDLGLICHTLENGNRLVSDKAPDEPDRSCPCLAGVCLVSAHAILPVGPEARIAARPPVALPATLRLSDAPAPPRPIDLFARASRGPPTRI